MAMRRIFFKLQRFAQIENSTSNTLVSGTSSADTIYNWGDSVTVEAGAGNDFVDSYGESSTLKGGDGDDTISAGLYNSVVGGSGNDSIYLGSGTVSAGAGNDYINVNEGGNVIQYLTGDGNDTVEGFGATDTLQIDNGYGYSYSTNEYSDVVITVGSGIISLVGAGNLSMLNIDGVESSSGSTSGNNLLITLTEGNDTYSNSLEGATINALGGDDTVSNYGRKVSIDTGEGNDSVHNVDPYATINTGEGNDTVYNDIYYYASINTGTGNDSVYNWNGRYATILTGAGNDTVYNNAGYYATINTGAGDDLISLHSITKDNVILYTSGDGNDIVYGFNDDDTLSIGGGTGTYSTTQSGNDIIVTVGDGAISLVGAANMTTLNIAGVESSSGGSSGNSLLITLTEGNDSYSNSLEGATIQALGGNDKVTLYGNNNSLNGGADNDYIQNYASDTTIFGGAGNDTISNDSENNSIDGGEGSDYIWNSGSNVSIDGGTGNDTIFNNWGIEATIEAGAGADTVNNQGWNSSINAGADNDSIYSDGFNNTISGGAGNDIISLVGSSNMIHYASGDGFDTIYGFNESETLSITGGSYSTQVSGSDVLVNVGSGSIRLVGAYGKNLNINRTAATNVITLTEGNDKFQSSLNGVSITALAGNDTIINYGVYGGDSVTVDGGAGDDSIKNSRGYYASIFGGAGNDTIFNTESKYVTVNAGTGNDYIENGDVSSYSVVDMGDGNDTIINFSSSKFVTILGGAGNDSIRNNASAVTINAGAGSDYIRLNYGSYDSKYNLIVYNAGDGNDLVEGFNGDDTLSIIGDSYSTQVSGNNIIVTVGDGNITLLGAASLSAVNISGAESSSGSGGSSGNPLLITLTENADTYYNEVNSATILALGGDDSIWNGDGYSNVSIDGAAGADYLSIYTGSNNTVTGGLGSDTIDNTGSSFAYLLGGAGNDRIINNYVTYNSVPIYPDYSTLDGGAGDDTISNYGNYVIINGGADNDYIYNYYAENVTVNGGTGDDSIESRGSNSTIIGGDGDDSIVNFASNVSINGGDGNDAILNGNGYSSVSIDGGAEGDYLSINRGSNNTVTGGLGNDIIHNTGSSFAYLNGGEGDDAIDNYIYDFSMVITLDYSTIDGGAGDDTISNYGDNSTVLGGEGNDYIYNGIHVSIVGSQVSIDGGTGNDSIENYGNNVSITGGTGDDYIQNGTSYSSGGNFVTVNAGDGADTIENYKSNVSLSGDEGDDSIYSHTNSNDITINGGAGADYIDINGIHLIEYSSGDGYDTVSGFNNSDTLQIGGGSGTYSSQVSGSDIIVSVGSGSIILQGAAYLDSVNIWGSEVATPAWTMINSTTAAYGTNSNTYFTVSGVKSTSGLSLSGNTVTVSSNSLNGSNVTISNGYKLALENGVSAPSTTPESWTLNGNVATYKASSTSAGYSVSNNQIIYTPASGGESFTVSGVKSTSGLSLNGTTVTVSSSALNNSNVTISTGYKLALASGIASPSTTAAAWTYSNNVATYKASSTSAGYSLVNGQIVYTSASGGNTLFTVSGVKSTSGLSLSGNTVTVSSNSLNNSNVSISNSNYKLALANGIASPSTTAAAWTYSNNVATYKAASTTAGYSLNNNQIVYTSASGGNTLFTVSGVKSTSGLSLSGNTVTVSSNSLNNSNVSISNSNYKLALGSGVTTSSTTAAGWTSSSNGIATYKAASNTAGYNLVNNQIVYTPASGGETFTISGISPYSRVTDYISVNGKTVTISKAALIAGNVTITGDGYNLALGSDVTDTTDIFPNWNISGTTATYQNSFTKTTYTLSNDGKSIVYSNTSWAEKLITVTGVKSREGLSLSGTTVTVSNSALNNSNVTISDGYNLALDSDVTKSSTTPESWSINGNIATYKASSTSVGYSLVNGQIVYTPASGGESFTVNGVKSTDGLSLSGKTVTVAASALNQSNVSISNSNYKLALASGIASPSTTAAAWTYSNNVATYKASSTSAGYSVVNGQIVYTAASGGETFTVNGVKSTDGLSLSGSTVTVAASALNGSNVTISGGYKLALANGIASPSTTAAAWSINNNVATYKASSTSAGYSLVNGQIVYTAASGGNTLFTVSGVKSTSGLSLSGNTVTVSSNSLNGSNVTISDGYNLALDSDVTKSSTTPESWSLSGTTATYKGASTTAGYSVVNGQIVYTAASGGNTLFTVSGVKSTSGLSLSGNTVTVSSNSLNNSNVSISNSNYKLALGSGVTTSSTTAASWSLSGTTATYKGASTTAGYSVSNNQIVYSSASGGNTLFTVSGVKSTDGLSLKGSTVTVAASALNQSNITISNGYKLALANGIASPSTTAAAWSINNNVATYKAASNTAGYNLVNGQIVYTAKKTATTLATVTGLKSGLKVTNGNISGITVSGNTITLAASVLGKTTVKVSGEYKLMLAANVSNPTTKEGSWTLKGTTATYKGSSSTAGYTVTGDGKSVLYSAATTAATLSTIKGIKTTSGISISDNFVNLKASMLNAKVTVSGEYGYNFAAGNYSKKIITGSKVADNIISNGKNLSINTGAGADSIKVTGNATSVTGGTGNDTIVNSGDNNIFIYAAGDGKDIIYGFDNTSKLKIGNCKGIYSSKTEGNDVIVTVGDGKITLVDAAKLDTVNILGKADVPAKNIDSAKNNVTINGTDYDDTIKSSGQYVKILSGAGHDSINVSGSNVTVNGATGDDTIVSSGKYVSINAGAGDNYVELTDKSTRQTVTSNAGDDYILNAGKNVSISTGAGNDTIITSGASVSIRGGNGADVFTFNGGGGVINDYAAEDIIRFTKGAAKVTTSGQNVIFTVGSNKVTVKGGKGKLITYYDTKGEHTYPTSVELSGKTATLLQNYSKDSFNVADYGTYNTINASAVTHDLTITANKNANRIIGSEENDYIEGLAGKDTILGGDGNDTILGGAGNDSLSGGKGSDVFVYSKGSGNDIITDYTNEDMIQIVDAKPTIKTSGNDVVFTVGNGKITVKNSAKKIITYTDSTGNPQTYFNTLVVNGTTATLTEMYTEKTYTAGAKIVMVDAADVNHNLKIMGNAKANVILGGSGNDSINGGAGKDTIHGGAGKDTILGGTGDDLLFGGEGADLFVYGNGGGKDVIGDYREEDKIKITSGTISKATAEGNDVVYKIGSGSITVLDGVGKNISFVNSNGKAIKPPTITINANVPYWFIQDDDAFTTAQFQLGVRSEEVGVDYDLGIEKPVPNSLVLVPSSSSNP